MQNTLPALVEIITIVEADEAKAIATEADKRRLRLTSTPMSAADTVKAVQREMLPTSNLPGVLRSNGSDFVVLTM